jgi:DNA-binding HxlR family transcriptional regulator
MDKRRILRLLSSRGTIPILRYLNEHRTAQYHQFNQFIITSTLNKRLRQLLYFNLINHYFMKEGVIKRKEWYELTEKGRKVLQIAEAIIKEADRG